MIAYDNNNNILTPTTEWPDGFYLVADVKRRGSHWEAFPHSYWRQRGDAVKVARHIGAAALRREGAKVGKIWA